MDNREREKIVCKWACYDADYCLKNQEDYRAILIGYFKNYHFYYEYVEGGIRNVKYIVRIDIVEKTSVIIKSKFNEKIREVYGYEYKGNYYIIAYGLNSLYLLNADLKVVKEHFIDSIVPNMEFRTSVINTEAHTTIISGREFCILPYLLVPSDHNQYLIFFIFLGDEEMKVVDTKIRIETDSIMNTCVFDGFLFIHYRSIHNSEKGKPELVDGYKITVSSESNKEVALNLSLAHSFSNFSDPVIHLQLLRDTKCSYYKVKGKSASMVNFYDINWNVTNTIELPYLIDDIKGNMLESQNLVFDAVGKKLHTKIDRRNIVGSSSKFWRHEATYDEESLFNSLKSIDEWNGVRIDLKQKSYEKKRKLHEGVLVSRLPRHFEYYFFFRLKPNWKLLRLLFIGKMKSDKTCLLSILPLEIVKEIANYIRYEIFYLN